MIDLLQRADPARDTVTDMTRLRAKVDERIGLAATLRAPMPTTRRPWLIAAVTFAAVVALAVPALLRSQPRSVFTPALDGIADLPGVGEVTPLASGGLQAAAVDGDTIWVVTMLQNLLQKVSAGNGEITATYPLPARVEGVVVGGGRLWLMTGDNGGEVLRFDPVSGTVDLRIPIGGFPDWPHWFGDRLWVSNADGELLEISAEGEVLSIRPGELKGGEGLGYLWMNDPETNLITSLSEDGTVGEIVIPTLEGLDTMSGAGVRQVAEADGRLFLMDGDYPWGTNLSVFDPATGEFGPFASISFGLLDLIELDGSLWITSHTDHLLFQVDPGTGATTRYPMPGKVAGLLDVDGKLWATLYHPGALVELDPDQMIEAAEIVSDDWSQFPYRLLCTGVGAPEEPTVILEPADWIEYGSWSVIQAQLSNEGHRVCAGGYMDGESTPQQRAAALEAALSGSEIPGPYLLVAAMDGVHTVRVFADGRDDIVGVVLADPTPIGYQSYMDDVLPGPAGGPPRGDLDPEVSDSLADFGDVPLVVIGQDPKAVFLSNQFVDFVGSQTAEAVNDFWQEGLDFYAGLSTVSESVVATGTGMDMVAFDRPELVVSAVLDTLERSARSG